MKNVLSKWGKNRVAVAFYALLAVLVVGGGASRADVQSLLVVRPIAAIVLAIGLYSLTWDHVKRHLWLFGVLISFAILMALHLVPLPPSVWTALPGRSILSEAETLVGIEQPWRPISMVPWRGWNSLFSMLIPLATLVVASQLDGRQLQRMLPVLLALMIGAAILGLLQIIGSNNGPLYYYDLTNRGAPVGIFANRNHAAVFLALLIPAAAAFAAMPAKSVEQLRKRQFTALLAAAIIVPVILVARSRAGLIVAALGMLSAVFIYRRPNVEVKARRRRNKVSPTVIMAGVILGVLGLVFFLAERATTLAKFTEAGGIDETRSTIWAVSFEAMQNQIPIGSGFGSFVEVYQMFEPVDALNRYYANHAHNDYLELVLVSGLPGLALLLVAVYCLAKRGLKLILTSLKDRGAARSPHRLLGLVSVAWLAQLAIASAVDYPLRTPMLAAIAVLACVWLTRADHDRERTKQG